MGAQEVSGKVTASERGARWTQLHASSPALSPAPCPRSLPCSLCNAQVRFAPCRVFTCAGLVHWQDSGALEPMSPPGRATAPWLAEGPAGGLPLQINAMLPPWHQTCFVEFVPCLH